MTGLSTTLTALSVFLCFTSCFTMNAFANGNVPSGRASPSDALKPLHDKVHSSHLFTADTASPSEMEPESSDLFEFHASDSGETFGFTIRKTGTTGSIKGTATFRLYGYYDDAVSDVNPIFFTSDGSGNTYTACNDSGCPSDGVAVGPDIYAGKVYVGGLEPGSYYLAEVQAPPGYEKLSCFFEVVLEDDGCVYYREETTGSMLMEAGEGQLTIENRAVQSMPGTGGTDELTRYAAAIVMFAAGMGWLRKRTRRDGG